MTHVKQKVIHWMLHRVTMEREGALPAAHTDRQTHETALSGTQSTKMETVTYFNHQLPQQLH